MKVRSRNVNKKVSHKAISVLKARDDGGVNRHNGSKKKGSN